VLAKIRGDLVDLALEKKIRLTQRGKIASPQTLKGPFRVALPQTFKSKPAEK
jgi:hypothetical protein